MMSDHARGCQGREYTCTCGYDDQQEALIRELMDGRHRDLDKMREMKALIRELLAALTDFLEFGEYAYSHGREALAKTKEQGYEP